ncbi:MAG TPA: toll/interleukin-1 receptor domain-containing protein [Bryobacteraceae bacterium]|nr:toll/interleukin-1 receptor domain-containing protein [Bryobacteraceae bacterium]
MTRSLRGKAILQLIDRYLRDGASIEIDGLGFFKLSASNQVVFEPNGRIRVFLAYAEEDRADVKRLYSALQKSGFEPWMDCEKLLPGQNWPRAIERAIDLSEFFICCFSRRSVAKRGHFQCELDYALTVAARVPAEEIFFLPVRLNECEVPREIARKVQHVNLFPDWDHGVGELLKAMWHQTLKRGKKIKVND